MLAHTGVHSTLCMPAFFLPTCLHETPDFSPGFPMRGAVAFRAGRIQRPICFCHTLAREECYTRLDFGAEGTKYEDVGRAEMTSLTVLMVEDDQAMADLVRTYLEHAGYTVLVAETGEEGIELAQRCHPHLILLDLMLPLLSGWETCRALRARANVPIIMVTALRAEVDRLRGFAEGADDYVIKPFSPRELVARVTAVLRRQQVIPAQVLDVGRLQIDPARREARVDGSAVSLREREFDLLLYLALHAGEVCARTTLLDHVWGYDFAGDERTIDSHVRRLRDALGAAGEQVRTVWGVGYKLVADAS